MKTWVTALICSAVTGASCLYAGIKIGEARKAKELEQEQSQRENDYFESLQYSEEVSPKELQEAMELWRKNHEDDQNTYYALSGKYTEESQGGDTDGDECADPDMVEEEPVIGDEAEIEQLHPQNILPEVITQLEYVANINGYLREDLMYYDVDRVVYYPPHRRIIEKPEELIGIGTLMGFDADPNNPTDILYVRNDSLGVMFRIFRMNARSTDEIGGMSAPEFEEEDEEEGMV